MHSGDFRSHCRSSDRSDDEKWLSAPVFGSEWPTVGRHVVGPVSRRVFSAVSSSLVPFERPFRRRAGCRGNIGEPDRWRHTGFGFHAPI